MLATLPFDPALALHAIEDANQRRGLDQESLGKLCLREFAFVDDKPGENLELPERDAKRGKFAIEPLLVDVRRHPDPIADAGFKVVPQQGISYHVPIPPRIR
jgi:hypothetical protein